MRCCALILATFLVAAIGSSAAAAESVAPRAAVGASGIPSKAKSGTTKKKPPEQPGASCNASGAPDCGGACSITCKVGQQAVCTPGRCMANQSPVCTCESRTSCACR